MNAIEKESLLSLHLAKFRAWSYGDLVQQIRGDCLERVEGKVADGTDYQVEVNVDWADKPNGNVRVYGDLCAEPQIRVLGFIYLPDVCDSFIMAPDGRFVGE